LVYIDLVYVDLVGLIYVAVASFERYLNLFHYRFDMFFFHNMIKDLKTSSELVTQDY